jgi:opacity protein-like surface antigen
MVVLLGVQLLRTYFVKTKTIQSLISIAAALLAIGASLPARADGAFYGGVSLRDAGAPVTGLQGDLPLTWTRFAAPVAEDTVQRSMAFGGYRLNGDVTLEGAFNIGDKYSLQPRLASPGGGGMGLAAPDPSARIWNADVFTSWEFARSMSLYGRLGYAQTDTRPLFAGASLVPGDLRRQRDGVNYGVGLRYDMSQSLGLRVEYARFGRFAGEGSNTGPLPESDQVIIGVQFKF